MYRFKKLYNCGMFQGAGKRKHYFEGWYYKNVDKDRQHVLSVIPGISIEADKTKSHAFIQIIHGSRTDYISYSMDQFWFSKERFEIRIGNNCFSEEGMELDIQGQDLTLKGRLSYKNPVHWTINLCAPNSMGWYGLIPNMECYHGVLSMKHDIWGSLWMDGKELCFEHGIGYMEKDWGTSFPSSWIWLQSNHFKAAETSVMLSIAKIPWHGKSFVGFIAGLWHQNKLYRFTTYTGAKLRGLSYNGTEIYITLTDKSHELTIHGKQGNTGTLKAPSKGAMTGSVMESINGTAVILLKDTRKNSVLLNAEACCCGMEIAGNIQELINRP